MNLRQNLQKSGKRSADPATSSDGVRSTVWLPALISSIGLLLAFPPLNLFPVAWIAPMGWLSLCQRPAPLGRKAYWTLWLSGCLFWLVSLHSIRLAFWALYAGWLALALYLAIYVPLFVAATRLMVHRWHIPLILSAPVAWTGLEWIRSYLFTGYAANTLAHSQAFQPILIQTADHLGTGGLSFLIMMFAACLETARNHWIAGNSTKLGTAGTAACILLGGMLGYGAWRLRQADQLAAENPVLLRCVLLQENTPSIFEMNPNLDAYYQRAQSAWTSYANLSRKAAADWSDIDLVVWPESTFTATTPWTQWDMDDEPLPKSLENDLQTYQMTRAGLQQSIEQAQQHFQMKARLALLAARGMDSWAQLPAEPGPELLVGCDHVRYAPDRVHRYNSAVWIRSDGTVSDIYHKMHLVVFGEYIPLRPLLGWLETWFSFAGTQPGSQPKAMEVADVHLAPNICFESMVPPLIRWQIQQLKRQGTNPQVLINLTNDSWFKGTSMLDHHLASSILCSVENRRPMLVAANTGITAEIDGSGRLLQGTQRFAAQALLTQPRRDGRWSMVQALGYPLSWLCAITTFFVFVIPKR